MKQKKLKEDTAPNGELVHKVNRGSFRPPVTFRDKEDALQFARNTIQTKEFGSAREEILAKKIETVFLKRKEALLVEV